MNKESAVSEKINPVRETDDEAIALASRLISETKYAALAVSETGTQVPLVSRIAAAWSNETGLFFCASDLSVHSKCLLENATCSLMLGEPGKGDGLAYPRITIIGAAERLPNNADQRQSLRLQFLAIHPKAELYVDFADFGFYPIKVERAQLNGGFGKAYHLNSTDLAFIGG